MEPVYNLVHVVSSGEYKTPLLATQVFERAEMEATLPGPGKPLSVQVWIILPMREAIFSKATRSIIKNLEKRCPNVPIKLIGGIGRFKNWPRNLILNLFRKKLKERTIYHCRGESSINEIIFLKKMYPQDSFILDVRGYWPLEKFVEEDVYFIKDMNAAQKARYDEQVNRLQRSIAYADRVCTVSEPLRKYLIGHDKAKENTVVIPCCVKETIADTNRDKIRKELNIENKIAILYLGGTQKYQNLEEMTIPFISSAIAQTKQAVGVFITNNQGEMEALLNKLNADMNNIRLLSIPQDKVGQYLTAMDMGIFLKVPSDLKGFYQPVKLGEYLSAGLPVILEEGTGEIATILNKYDIGFVVKLYDKNQQEDFDGEVAKTIDWYKANEKEVRARAKQFVQEHYTWQANIQHERNMYMETLMETGKVAPAN